MTVIVTDTGFAPDDFGHCIACNPGKCVVGPFYPALRIGDHHRVVGMFGNQGQPACLALAQQQIGG